MKRIKLGRTLRRISEEGIETFYNGSLADQIIDEIQKKGWRMICLKKNKFKEIFRRNINKKRSASIQIRFSRIIDCSIK